MGSNPDDELRRGGGGGSALSLTPHASRITQSRSRRSRRSPQLSSSPFARARFCASAGRARRQCDRGGAGGAAAHRRRRSTRQLAPNWPRPVATALMLEERVDSPAVSHLSRCADVPRTRRTRSARVATFMSTATMPATAASAIDRDPLLACKKKGKRRTKRILGSLVGREKGRDEREKGENEGNEGMNSSTNPFDGQRRVLPACTSSLRTDLGERPERRVPGAEWLQS